MIVLVMGVSGVGKTTIGCLLASAIGGRYLEGDDFHTPGSLAKMRAGIPLGDEDRLPWLHALGASLQTVNQKDESVILGCSALRESYRRLLLTYCPSCKIVWLYGQPELVAARIEGRTGHFMPAHLLSSQFAILEPPADAIAVSISHTPEEMLRQILKKLSLKK
jgi:carbohydrate kinase (thermoresistant glucokinase family)